MVRSEETSARELGSTPNQGDLQCFNKFFVSATRNIHTSSVHLTQLFPFHEPFRRRRTVAAVANVPSCVSCLTLSCSHATTGTYRSRQESIQRAVDPRTDSVPLHPLAVSATRRLARLLTSGNCVLHTICANIRFCSTIPVQQKNTRVALGFSESRGWEQFFFKLNSRICCSTFVSVLKGIFGNIHSHFIISVVLAADCGERPVSVAFAQCT